MRISTMLIIMTALPLAAGVGENTLKKARINRKNGLFFLLCMLAMSGFEVFVTDETAVSPACVLAAAWLFAASFAKGDAHKALLSISASMLAGAAASGLMSADAEWAAYLCGACALPACALGLLPALGTAAAAPLFAAAFDYALVSEQSGYAVLELTETALSAQLSGIFICSAAMIAKELIVSYVRTKQFVRAAESVKTD